MMGLKTFLPVLEPLLDLSPAALYERQRALVRIGLLPKPDGRGPGSGARATPRNVAVLLTSVMTTDNWSDTDQRVKSVLTARDQIGDRFHDVLERVLASPETASEVKTLQVSRQILAAELHWNRGAPVNAFFSAYSHSRSGQKRWLRVWASLEGGALVQIAKSL